MQLESGDKDTQEDEVNHLSIENLLGGKETIGYSLNSEIDLYELCRAGLPKKSLMNLAGRVRLPISSISRLLHIPERTLQEKKDSDLLNETLSEHVIQIAEVYSRGNEIFDSMEAFQTWVDTPNTALGKRKPIDLLPSRYGAKMVMKLLGRIEHGIFS